MLLVRLLFILINLCILQPALSSCPPVSWHQTVTLQKINDGDTVTLSNGRLVRFIGIDTPEINYRQLNKSDPFALQAKALLEKYIKTGDKLHLVFDKTKQDKYGRILAYVYSKTGRNLALLQLQAGFAKHWVIGNNDQFWRCFQSAEHQSRIQNKGIWSAFSPLSAAKVEAKDKGYVYMKGTITETTENSRGLELVLDGHVKVRIKAKNLTLFTDENIKFSVHKSLLLRGKLYFKKGKPYMSLYHPSQLLP